MKYGKNCENSGFRWKPAQGFIQQSFDASRLGASAKRCSLEVFDLKEIPPFNQDLESQPPTAVKAFKAKIKQADALLIATPEYNYSIPGVLKNAIDWASRPHGDNAFECKPVAMMSASIGRLGGARAQYHLRQSFVFLNMYPLNRPEVMMPYAQEHVDENGNLTDGTTRQLIRQLLEELVRWTRTLMGNLDSSQ